MPKTIYLSLDLNCFSLQKYNQQILGGTEQFFMRLRQWLLDDGTYEVHDPIVNPLTSGQPDLTIHSNTYNFQHHGKKNILFAGSWHASAHAPVDKVICVSKFMRDQMGAEATIIPAPYGADIERYKGVSYIPGRIICTSNPNRHIQHLKIVAKILKDRKLNVDVECCGGNRLYSDGFGENFHFSDPNLIYRGILSRHEMIGLLTSSHIWIYPNFSDGSETLCVSALEAMSLELPTILPAREPFLSNMPRAFFVNSEIEMAAQIEDILRNGPHRVEYNVRRYSEDYIRPQWLGCVQEVLEK